MWPLSQDTQACLFSTFFFDTVQSAIKKYCQTVALSQKYG